MKKILLLCGQGSENYAEKLLCKEMSRILREREVEILLPKNVRSAIWNVLKCDGVVYAGRRRGNVDPFEVLSTALEMGKPIFLFGTVIGELDGRSLKRLSTILMSPSVTGFVTDEVSYRWARLWSRNRIEVGVDVVHALLKRMAKREKSRFAVFVPQRDGTLKDYVDLKWLPNMDTRIVVANSEDSRAAVKFSRNLKTDEVVILSEPEDIIETIANAKFVLSERFYVSITAATFGVPFIHVGRKAERYFGGKLTESISSPDEIEIALQFSKILENPKRDYSQFNVGVDERFEEMIKKLEDFLDHI